MSSTTPLKFDAPRPPLQLVVVIIGLVLTTVMALLVSDGNVVIALAPTFALAAVWAMVVFPLSHSLIVLFAICLLFYNPGMRPHDGKWTGPLVSLGNLLYDNLRNIVGVDALRFNAIELVLTFLLIIAGLRWLVGSRIDNPEGTSTPRPLKLVLMLTCATLMFWIVWGIARGGDFKQMLWQTRQIMWAPIMSAMFIHAFRKPAWHKALGIIVLCVAIAHSLDGVFFFYTIVKPQALFVEYSITHEDSMLLITSLMMLIALILERPTKRMIMAVCCLAPIIFLGLVVNHRRLAYVSLAACLLAVFLVMNAELRKRITRVAIIAAPIIALYVGAGIAAKGESAIFLPIRSLVSVADQKNASNQTRDIENYNLLYTFRGSPLVGSGFGHPYNEVSVAYSIAGAMPNYRYIAHNSVLWLLMLTGGVGFTGMWLGYVVSIFLGARVYRLTTDPYVAAAALTSIAVIICYIFQAFGDMGMISWMGVFLLAGANSVIGTMATATGAWSNDTPPPVEPPPRDDEPF